MRHEKKVMIATSRLQLVILIAFVMSCFCLPVLADEDEVLVDETVEAPKSAKKATEKKQPNEPVSARTPQQMKLKLIELEEQIDRLEAEVEVLKTQNQMVIQRTNLGFLNASYFKGGVALVLPRSRSFDFRTDTGLGFFIGAGHYFGRNHVVDLSFDWDLYPAASLRYRFEFHFTSPNLTLGPVVGYKLKLAAIRPIDNFLDRPERVSSNFWFYGVILGFPMSRALGTFELLYLTHNPQALFFTNVALHFFI